MLVGPYSIQHFSVVLKEYQDKNKIPEAQASVTAAFSVFVVLFILCFIFYIWNIYALCVFWNELSTPVKVLAVVSIFVGCLSPISLICIYSTKNKMMASQPSLAFRRYH